MNKPDISSFLQRAGWSTESWDFPEKEFISFIGRVDIRNQIGILRYGLGN